MGNDVSLQKSVIIDEKATEVTAYWSMYGGEWTNGGITNSLSLFKGDSSSEDAFWKKVNPLEKAGKNLMLLRHPNILKFVNSWNKSGEFNLATEHAKPLSLCLKSHNAIQICLGLRSVLQAVTFLVEKANTRHLNLCMASVYVTDDGTWKLCGFEFLYPPAELTPELLEHSLRHRYQKAVDDKNEIKTGGVAVEQFAFAVFCRDIFKMHPQVDAPFLSEFQDYCRTQIETVAPNQRPSLSSILEQPYFNQDFVRIHEFLTKLPLKSAFERQEFFTDLVRKLKTFEERDVAVHLGDLLLSRMVLLDETAQISVTPFVLDPKSDELVPGLFTIPTFTQFIIPKLKQIFTVHDMQIRMILLEHFHKFMSLFPENELKGGILPQLLLGIKDTNDHLVSMTLRCLADLVPILGASIVIGKNRNRIFSDGRPQRVADNNPLTRHWPEARSITPVMEASSSADNGLELCQQSFADVSTENLMPVRLAPDGGEDVEEISGGGALRVLDGGVGVGIGSSTVDEDQWSDWDDNNEDGEEVVNREGEPTVSSLLMDEDASVIAKSKTATKQATPEVAAIKTIADSLNELDIQVKATKDEDEMDFFKDMEPVILGREVNLFATALPNSAAQNNNTDVAETNKTSRLTIQASVAMDDDEDAEGREGEGGGWGDSDWE